METRNEQKSYPKWHFIWIWVAIWIPLGIPVGLAIWNIALWPLLWLVIWIPLGYALEKSKNPNPRELSESEKKIMKRNMTISLVVWIIVAFGVALLYYFWK